VEKPAETHFPIHDLLARRWSSRAFDDCPVDGGTLRILLEAAQWAPSSNNEQPWRFIVANKADHEAEWSRLLNCLMEGNRAWALRAPVLLLSVASMYFERGGQPNRHAFHDVGLATENLVLQATANGLITHQMAGFDVEKARIELGIPVGYEPVVMIAIGYPGDPALLPERLQERERQPRSRKPIHDRVFMGQWGTSITE
jgi:nitroreductase